MNYDQAEEASKKLLGPRARIKFIRQLSKAKRYVVGAVTMHEGRQAIGVIGEGASWVAALEDAKLRKETMEAEEEG
jgi:hypothetical protein